jgi:hypothetical protein
MARDDEWNQWRQVIFGDPYLVWHDGPGFDALLAAARADLDAVGHFLASGIRLGDPLAAQSFRRLAADDLLPVGAPETLRAAAGTATGEFLIRVAEALFAVTADPSWARPVADVLATDGSASVRLAAAMALAAFPATPELVQALARAVCDPEYLLRYHAANTLLRYAGDTRSIAEHRELFAKIAAPQTGAATADHQRARRDAAGVLTARALNPN